MDKVSKKVRSKMMSKIRSKGNKTTEKRLRAGLVSSGICGWRMHASDIDGTPDFFFEEAPLAVFVDGCYWHGFPMCYRRPKSRQEYWDKKLARNMARDARVSDSLQAKGVSVMRIWEHEVNDLDAAVGRIRKYLKMRNEKDN